jgi:uncharacterized protein
MQLSGMTVLLTGASGGIGHAIARALGGRGARVILTGRRADALENLRATLPPGAEVLTADLSQAGEATRLAQAAGAVDVLVANAGVPASGAVVEFTPEQIDRALDVNLRAPMQLARALVPGMVERGRGHLVFVSSLAGKAPSARSGIYSATKFGLRGFAGGLREDLVGTGVGVSVVFPGFVSGAGMFAEAGVKLPPGVGSRPPEAVAGAVLRAVERDRAEIDVAPLGLRLGARAWGLAPSAIAGAQRRLGSEKLADALASGQRSKR